MPRRLIRWTTRALDALRAGRGRPLAAALALPLAAALAMPDDGALPAARLALFDSYQLLLPRQRLSGPVQIIAVDEAALKRYGQWPWPRTRLAELIDRAAAQRPLVIGLDLLMPEPDGASPEALAAQLAPGPLRDGLAALPSNDQALAAAMRRVPVVLAAAGFDDAATSSRDVLRAWPVRLAMAGAGGAPAGIPGAASAGRPAPLRSPAGALPPQVPPQVPRYRRALGSLPLLQAAASGQGMVSAELEKGVVRRVPLLGAVGGTLLPGLSLELLRVATGAEAIEVDAGAGGVRAIAVGDLRVATRPDGAVWVNYSAPAPARYASALDLMQGRLAPDALRDKIVIVALTGLGLADYKTNARGDLLPGVDVHAQLIEGFFDGAQLRRPAGMRWAEALCFAVLAGGVICLLPRLRLLRALPLSATLAAALFAAGLALFRAGLLFDAAGVAAALGLVCLSLWASLFGAAVRARHRSERSLRVAREAEATLAGELNAARRIQMASLPQAASAFPGELRFTLDALLEPARQVGGDLYDFFMLDRRRLFFLLGDVSGKGLPASLFMVVAKALSKSVALRDEAGMAAIMCQANRELLRENPENLFVTCVAGILDADSGEVMLCNAGHDAPRLLSGGGVERLRGADGPPLCVIEEFDYPVQRYQLRPGDCLCLNTDGVTEAMDAAGQVYGNARLDSLLAVHSGQGGTAPGAGAGVGEAALTAGHVVPPGGGVTPADVVRAVREDVRAHVGAAEPSDDLALLVLRWNGPAA
ncbi:CHASE2 domain-containing protein [Rugamonas sp. CCM 8940]|uniref:CHASE2 domain-containing protein n=1 Tax=Rugamonas sp. CCM 8940 TaxID=2765359 RepID=UPI0018F75480|nr:CHASE2 domain-containing protein [Rugamonas sp. CCM 8940]MBJ7310910.1 CHASE2 domain-containing protein [Rugamonas sp. CCM 8940]